MDRAPGCSNPEVSRKALFHQKYMDGQVQCRELFSSGSAAQTSQPIFHHKEAANYAHRVLCSMSWIADPFANVGVVAENVGSGEGEE